MLKMLFSVLMHQPNPSTVTKRLLVVNHGSGTLQLLWEELFEPLPSRQVAALLKIKGTFRLSVIKDNIIVSMFCFALYSFP